MAHVYTCTFPNVSRDLLQVCDTLHEFVACEVADERPVSVLEFPDPVHEYVVEVVTECLRLCFRVGEDVDCIVNVALGFLELVCIEGRTGREERRREGERGGR